MLDTDTAHREFSSPRAPDDGDRLNPAGRPRRLSSGGGGSAARPNGDGGGSFDVRNSWQIVVGSILIPLGLVIILIAWYGAAHARVVQQQIPYMVSGSFIGLGCMVVGGFCYWSHWLYRLYDQSALQHEEQQRVLESIARSLTDGGQPGTNRSSLGPSVSTIQASVATATGTVYHRQGCPVIAHHPQDLRVLGPDGAQGLQPCQICSPG